MKNIKVHWLEYFDHYENDPTMVSRLSFEELEAIVGRILFNRRNLLPHLKQMREDCQKELERRKANIKKHESALIKKEILYNERLSVQYDEVEKYWKSIENGPADRRDIKVTNYRRAIGQWMHDLPKLHTGGLAADEVATVLKKDEGVFTPGQMKAIGKGIMKVWIII